MKQGSEQAASVVFAGRGFGDILGPMSGRYFGAGFRRVAHAIRGLDVRENLGGTMLQGVGTAAYPDDWSLDASGLPREVHLSSFDAIALTAVALRTAASSRTFKRPLLEGRVLRVRVHAPARPILATDKADVIVHWSETTSGGEAHVSSRVASFGVQIDIANESGRRPVDLQLHDRRTRGPLGSGTVLGVNDGDLVTTQELVADSSDLSCVEELAMFGQLSQIAVYAAKGVNRQSVPNLWLRRLALERSAAPLRGSVESRVRVVRDRVVRIGGEEIADLVLAARTNYGAQAEASFGFRVPS